MRRGPSQQAWEPPDRAAPIVCPINELVHEIEDADDVGFPGTVGADDDRQPLAEVEIEVIK